MRTRMMPPLVSIVSDPPTSSAEQRAPVGQYRLELGAVDVKRAM
jgi:hypothetical protein